MSGRTKVKKPPSKPRDKLTKAFASLALFLEYSSSALLVSTKENGPEVWVFVIGVLLVGILPFILMECLSAMSNSATSSKAELTPKPKKGFTVCILSPTSTTELP